MIWKRFILFLLIFYSAAISFPAFAQKPNAEKQQFTMSVKQAIDYAMQNQPKVLNALIDEKIARRQVNEVTGIGLPQINGSVEFTDYIKTPQVILPEAFRMPGSPETISFQRPYNLSAGVTLSQLIFDGSYIVGLRASKTFVDLSRKNTQRTKIQTAADVSKAYYGVILNEKRLSLIDANITRLTKSYNDLKAMYEQGFVEKIDVDRLQVTLNSLEVERQKLQNFISLNYNLLKFQMGMPINAQLVLTDSISENSFSAPVAEELNYNKRIEYSLLQTQRTLNTLDMKRYQVGYLPSLAGFASYSYQAQRDSFDFFDPDGLWLETGLIGLKLNIPIFDGLQKHARIQQSKLALEKTENDIINLKNAIDLEYAQASVTYENTYKTLETQRKNMELAQEIVRVSQIKYTEGVGSNLEVVTAEASLKEAQTNYYNALYDAMIAQIDLQKAKGMLY